MRRCTAGGRGLPGALDEDPEMLGLRALSCNGRVAGMARPDPMAGAPWRKKIAAKREAEQQEVVAAVEDQVDDDTFVPVWDGPLTDEKYQ